MNLSAAAVSITRHKLGLRFLRYSFFCLFVLFSCSQKLRVEFDFLHFEMMPFGQDDPFALATTELSYRLWYRVRLWAEAELGYEFLHPGAEGSEGALAAAPKLRRYELDSQYSQPVSRISWGDAVVWSNALTEYYNCWWFKKNVGQGGVSPLQVVYRNLDGSVLRSALQANTGGEYFRSAQANGFRLPSEREWELAGRQIDRRRWQSLDLPAGAAYPSEREYHRFSRYARNSNLRSWPSASREATQMGLYDMSGNLAEWVEDHFNTISPKNVLLLRTLKGGAYLSPALELAVGGRLPAMPQQAHKSMGFRIARSIDDTSKNSANNSSCSLLCCWIDSRPARQGQMGRNTHK